MSDEHRTDHEWDPIDWIAWPTEDERLATLADARSFPSARAYAEHVVSVPDAPVFVGGRESAIREIAREVDALLEDGDSR